MSPSSPSGKSKRLRARARYDVLDAPLEEGFNRVIRLAARWLKVPIALVTLLDKERRRVTFCGGLPWAETPREGAFCLDALSGPGLLVVEDAAADPRFAGNPAVTGTPGLRFYAGVPLVAPDGPVVGALCVIDTEPRRAETMELDVLHDLAGIVVSELELRAASEGLCEGNRQLRALSRELRAAQENDRSRLSRLLQEELRQVLLAARMTLDNVVGSGDLPDGQAERLRRMGTDLAAATELVQSLSTRFAPPVGSQPFYDTLLWLADQMTADHGLSVTVEGEEGAGAGADEGLKTLLYRVVREGLFAARRRGGATTARVCLTETDGRLRVVVEDDGLGDRSATDRCQEDDEMGRLRTQLEALGGHVAVHADPDACVTTVEGPSRAGWTPGAAPPASMAPPTP